MDLNKEKKKLNTYLYLFIFFITGNMFLSESKLKVLFIIMTWVMGGLLIIKTLSYKKNANIEKKV